MSKDYKRVFIAIEFSDDTKKNIVDIKDDISKYSTAGNYTLEDNLHLTVKFIGQVETSTLHAIQNAMRDTVQSIEPFNFTIDHMGRFVRRRKSLIWLGISDGVDELSALHRALDKNLSTYGIPRDKRDFMPHITIGREVDLTLPIEKLKETVIVEPMPIYVDSLTLMESTRVNGRLVYVPLYRCPLASK